MAYSDFRFRADNLQCGSAALIVALTCACSHTGCALKALDQTSAMGPARVKTQDQGLGTEVSQRKRVLECSATDRRRNSDLLFSARLARAERQALVNRKQSGRLVHLIDEYEFKHILVPVPSFAACCSVDWCQRSSDENMLSYCDAVLRSNRCA